MAYRFQPEFPERMVYNVIPVTWFGYGVELSGSANVSVVANQEMDLNFFRRIRLEPCADVDVIKTEAA